MVSPSPCAARLMRTETQQWSQEPPAWEPRDRQARPWACRQLQAQFQAQPQGQLQWEPQGLPQSPVQFQTPAQHQLLLQEPEDEKQKGLEKMEAYNDSSGYESSLTSLDDEENDDDFSSKSGVLCLTTSSCEELVLVCESTQLVLDSSLCNKEQQEEEQQEVEVSCEEDLPCVPVFDLAACESGDGAELLEAPGTPDPLPGALGVFSGLASCRPGPINPDWRVRPPNLWGPADCELEPWPSIFWPCSCFLSYTGPCCNWGARSP